MTPETEKATRVFFPYTWERLEALHASGARLVHYCSADTAISIIKNRRVWMRNASMMNDYSEIKYGLDVFFLCWNDAGLQSKLKAVLDEVDQSCFQDLEERVKGISDFIDESIYLVCLSEQYEASEPNRESVKSCGRLSMWRAYGGETNVAVTLNLDAFFNDTDALSVYSSPVCYGRLHKFRSEFVRLCNSLQEHQSYLRQLGSETVASRLINAFIFAIVSFKHPGFSEEREWRIVYLEGREGNKGVLSEIKSIGGTPQKIYQIPLEDDPDQGLVGIEIQDLIHEVLIGPVKFSENVATAIETTLKEAGVENPGSRVRISSIPFRR